MADGTTPASATSTTTTPSSVSSADVANANALNQAVSAIRQQLAADNTATIGILNSIASAITNSMVGGTSGTAANHVLISKGTTGFAMQPSSVVTVDAPNGALQISSAAAGSTTEMFRVKPTDFALNKPYLALKTGSANQEWQLLFWDGTKNAGQLSVFCTNINCFTFDNNDSFGGFATNGPDGHTLRLTSSLPAGAWNNLVQAGDNAVTYNNGTADTGNLVVGPQSTKTNGAGFRMDSNGITSFVTEVGFVQTNLVDAATIAWDMNQNQCATVTLGGNRTMGTPTNVVAGFTYVLTVQQDGTGGRTLTFPNPPFKFPSGVAPVLSTNIFAVDIFTFYALATTAINGVLQKNFA